jgi:hypothetical protein
MDIENSIRNITDYVSSGPFNSLFVNPIYISLLLTCVVLIIVLFMYEGSKLVKTGFYIFLSSLLLIFIHNQLLLVEHRDALMSSDEMDIISNIDSGPSITGGNDDLDLDLTDGLSYLNTM